MDQPSLFDGLEHGRQLKEQGIARAIRHADDELPTWSAQAYEYARRWILRRGAVPFFMHEIRQDAERDGLPSPPELRAWGALPRRLVRAGLIRHVGIFPSSQPEQHMAPKSKWQRAL